VTAVVDSGRQTHVAAWPDSDPDILSPVPEHEELRDVLRQLVDRRMSHEQLRAVVESPPGYSPPLWAALNRELDLGAMAAPEELGGAGFGVRELGVVLEVTGGALLAEPILASAVLGVQALLRADEPSAVADLRERTIRGDAVATVWFGDPSTLVAGRSDDAWSVRGVARRVLQGGAADVVVVPAGVDGGTALFVVDVSGAAAVARTVMDLTRPQADVPLDGLPATLLVGPEGFPEAWQALRLLADIGVACEHVGMIERLLAMTTGYVTQRHQFGRPIGSFQAVKHRLADVLVDLERARSAARYAAAVYDGGPAAAALPAAVAAAVCTDAVVRVAHEAVQLHGGIGFTWEHPAHFYVRRALGDEGLFGDSRRHRARIAQLIGV
jgi:acyl-CoA dehydrogenase